MDTPVLDDFEQRFRDPAWHLIAIEILGLHRIRPGTLVRAEQGENIVFVVDDTFVLKIYTPRKSGYDREVAGLTFATGKIGLTLPKMLECGEFAGYKYLLITKIDGHAMSRADWLRLDKRTQTGLVIQLAQELRRLHSHGTADFNFDWKAFLSIQIETAVQKQVREGGNPNWVRSIPAYFETHLPLIPPDHAHVFQHGDVHFGNLRLADTAGKLRFSGLFDFADSIKGFHEYDFLAVGVLMIQGQGDLQREFFRAYGYPEADINEDLRNRLFLLTMLYEYSSLRRYAERLGVDPMNYELEELGQAIWNFA